MESGHAAAIKQVIKPPVAARRRRKSTYPARFGEHDRTAQASDQQGTGHQAVDPEPSNKIDVVTESAERKRDEHSDPPP